jgi:hypothetical protein
MQYRTACAGIFVFDGTDPAVQVSIFPALLLTPIFLALLDRSFSCAALARDALCIHISYLYMQVAAGDSVAVSGTVTEFRGATTDINSTSAVLCVPASSGNLCCVTVSCAQPGALSHSGKTADGSTSCPVCSSDRDHNHHRSGNLLVSFLDIPSSLLRVGPAVSFA